MDLTGERMIPASQERVWAALNDPDVLRACIPGCETLTKDGDTGFAATVVMKVGPVKARMEGEVALHDIDAPNGYTLAGKGKGAAGFASGEARVRLTDKEGSTHLTYRVTAKIGGKLAEVGARFIDSTAQKMADQFFDAFVASLAAPPIAGASGARAETLAAAGPAPGSGRGRTLLVAGGVAVLALVLYHLLS